MPSHTTANRQLPSITSQSPIPKLIDVTAHFQLDYSSIPVYRNIVVDVDDINFCLVIRFPPMAPYTRIREERNESQATNEYTQSH